MVDDRRNLQELARRIAKVQRIPARMVGEGEATGPDVDVENRQLPAEIGTEGQVLGVIENGDGDLQVAWVNASGSALAIYDGGSIVDAGVDTIVFDADWFTVTESPEDTAIVDIAEAYLTTFLDTYLDAGAGSATSWVNSHQHGQLAVNPTTGTVFNDGMSTGTSAGTSSNADDTDGAWLQLTQTTTSSYSGRSNMQAGFFPDWSFTFVGRIKTYTTITSQRIWVGMFSSTLATATDNDLPASTSLAAFRHSTNASDANWMCVSSDGSGNYETTDSGIAVATSQAKTLRVHYGTTSVKFLIDNVLVATHTTRVPASGASMGWLICCKNLVGGGSARGIKWGWLSMSHIR